MESREKEFSLRDIIKIFKKYKYLILAIMLMFFVGSYIYSFYKPNIYKASSTVLIEKEEKQTLKPEDVLGTILNVNSVSNLNTEKEIIKSRFLVQKVIEELKLNEEYSAIDSFYKKHFYYKDKPLIVDINTTSNIFIKIIPKSSNSFILVVKGASKDGKNFSFKKEINYNKTIENKFFTLKIKKNNQNLNMKEYYIQVYQPSYLANLISNNRLSVENVGKDTSILKISYIDTIPQRAKDFVNFLTKIYMEQNLENKTKEIIFTLNFINKQLEKIKKNMNIASKSLEKFKKKNNTIDIKESIKKLSNQLANYENQKNILTFKIKALEKILKRIYSNKNLETITLNGTTIKENGIDSLVNQLQDALIKRKLLLKDYTNAHPEIQKLNSKIQQLKVMIKKSVKNLLANLKYQERILNRKLSSLNKKLRTLSKSEQDFVNLDRKFLLNSKFYSYLLQKKTEAELKKAATINRNRVLDYAVLPDKPIEPQRRVIYIIGISFGFLIAFIVSFILYLLNDKIEDVEDIENAIGKNKIAGLISKSNIDKRDISMDDLENKKTLNEFRTLRSNLSLILNFDKGGVVSVNSTTKGEGKSYIASFLAKVTSMTNKSVLIIDCSEENSSIANIFKIENKKGLTDYLIGKESNAVNLIEKKDNLSILPMGNSVKNFSELISSKKFQLLISELKNIYDIIIIDTSSFESASEVKDIMRLSDVVLYIFRVKYSKKDYLEVAQELLKNRDGVAVVVNFVRDLKDKYKHNIFKIDKIKSI